MPIYEYRCAACGHEIEVLQRLSDAPPIECPSCHASALTKKVSAAGFQLKGSGWYVTDFRNQGAKKAKDAPAKEDAAKANGGEAKADGAAKDKPTAETAASPATSATGSATEAKPKPASSDKTGT